MTINNELYNNLFKTNEDKAKSFDKIAENFYFGNFGTMSKSDLEVLMFSIYIEQILDVSEEHENTYSDYTLSKSLGIMQSKVNTLKVKKELKYPRKNFDWRKSFARLYENAKYDNGKICMQISDRNVYLELKNAIEMRGGYVDVTLNSKLLKLPPSYFMDLIVEIADENEKSRIKEIIEEKVREENLIVDDNVPDTWRDIITDSSTDLICGIIEKCLPISGDIIKRILKKTNELIKKRM